MILDSATASGIIDALLKVEQQVEKVADLMLTKKEYEDKSELQYYKTVEKLEGIFIKKEDLRITLAELLSGQYVTFNEMATRIKEESTRCQKDCVSTTEFKNMFRDEMDRFKESKTKWWQDKTNIILMVLTIITTLSQLKQIFAGVIK